ncbi:Butyrate kinase 2 [uncultured Roseburia sp.]|uniref:Probable butyrate kinase n=1 Tax=Brotonthovivens ammoniilytica TaxID=2981725 RepID=A0ABT2TFB7_9FIRM|nr:butyrate kinase [Brotonthovivens ammoniilytica]MCU6760842.1 butyrate kinase [Brotonthovivens ammoniilytica]SCI10956.1 Butyrate kinase 2 [uncultured Roseburia sp.]
MKKDYKVFVINPGSTSTKVAMFENEKKIFQTNVDHPVSELDKCQEIPDQLPLRLGTIKNALTDAGVSLDGIDAIATRSGSLAGLEGGVYSVNEKLLEDSFTNKYVKHPNSLGPTIAKKLQEEYGGEIFCVNPPDVDELCDYERVCGFHEFARVSRGHPLNHKENCIRYAQTQGKTYEEMNLIVCHLGGGVTVGAHQKGKMFCVNDGINGDGPMAPTRAGWLPATSLVKMCFSGDYAEKEIMDRITKKGGLIDHLGTADAREIVSRIKEGDKYAELIYNAFIWQIAKAVGGCAAAMKGEVDAIILTGGIAYDTYLTGHLKEYISWIAPVEDSPGELEMEGLASGAIRAMEGVEEIKVYTGIPVWSGFSCAPVFHGDKSSVRYY